MDNNEDRSTKNDGKFAGIIAVICFGGIIYMMPMWEIILTGSFFGLIYLLTR